MGEGCSLRFHPPERGLWRALSPDGCQRAALVPRSLPAAITGAVYFFPAALWA